MGGSYTYTHTHNCFWVQCSLLKNSVHLNPIAYTLNSAGIYGVKVAQIYGLKVKVVVCVWLKFGRSNTLENYYSLILPTQQTWPDWVTVQHVWIWSDLFKCIIPMLHHYWLDPFFCSRVGVRGDLWELPLHQESVVTLPPWGTECNVAAAATTAAATVQGPPSLPRPLQTGLQ